MKVHMIGNAHLDPVWLWRWQEGCAEVLATFQSALERMEEFDDYIFTCAGAAYYQWVQEIDPDMFAKIQRRVREGRWVIVGGWHIQPDCNAPGGESFVRHSLYSQKYYQKYFGLHCRTGYNVDSFGHNAMLPQLLKLSGMENYVYMRPSQGPEMDYPMAENAFLWEGVDGTQVKAFRIPDAYGFGQMGAEVCNRKMDDISRLADQLSMPEMCFYGVGNHGGGPTIDNLNAVERRRGAELDYSSPDRYFDELTKPLPVWKGELQHHASGCYSTVMAVKALNRRAEARLQAAEAFEVISRENGASQIRTDFSALWKPVLFNQFHDIMGGCSIRSAYDDAIEGFGESLNASARSLNRSLQSIARRIDTSMGRPMRRNSRTDWRWFTIPGRGAPAVVLNPFSWPVKAPVRTGARFAAITDADGNPIPVQRVRSQVTNGADDKHEDIFIATVPPMGWATYEMYPQLCQTAASSRGLLEASETTLENDYLRAEFDPATGALIRLFHKKQGRDLICAPALPLVMDDTQNDTWAHNVFSFRDVLGSFSQAKIKLVEQGDVMCCLRVETRFGSSTLRQSYTLYRELPMLHVDVRVFWNEQHKILKLSFPTRHSGDAVSAIPYGFLNRLQNGKEQPMGGWVRMGDLGLATDSRAAYDAEDGELRLTCLRSPIFADHYGQRDDRCEFSEQGEHRFEYSLFAGASDQELAQEAARLACPLPFLVISHHEGPLPHAYSALSIVGNAQATTLKYAEDGEDIILRLHETANLTSPISVSCLGCEWSDTLHPQEIATYRLRGGAAQKVNLLEEPLI